MFFFIAIFTVWYRLGRTRWIREKKDDGTGRSDENSGDASLPAIDHYTSTPFYNRYIQVFISHPSSTLAVAVFGSDDGKGVLENQDEANSVVCFCLQRGRKRNTRQKKHTTMLSYCRCAVGKGRKTEGKGAEGGRGWTKELGTKKRTLDSQKQRHAF